MPVPRSKQKKYGMIVGHMQNLGLSLEEAKNKTDKALGLDVDKKGKKRGKKK